MTLDLVEIEALARAATPGPWQSRQTHTDYYGDDGEHRTSITHRVVASPIEVAQATNQKDVSFIGALGPDVVLALIGRIRDLETRDKRIRAALESVKAALGDRLFANGPLSEPYAHAVMSEINTALEKQS